MIIIYLMIRVTYLPKRRFFNLLPTQSGYPLQIEVNFRFVEWNNVFEEQQ